MSRFLTKNEVGCFGGFIVINRLLILHQQLINSIKYTIQTNSDMKNKKHAPEETENKDVLMPEKMWRMQNKLKTIKENITEETDKIAKEVQN